MTAQSISAALARTQRRASSLPLPHDYLWLTARDVSVVVAGIGAVIAAMWLRHGGLSRDPLTMIREVTALGGTYAALLGVLFASRAPWLDQVFGADGLPAVHRWLGFVSVWAIAGHAVFSTLAFAGGSLGDVVPVTAPSRRPDSTSVQRT